MRIHHGFTPGWFAARMELDYGPDWHAEPRRRLRSFQEMGRALNREFPELRLGGEPDKMVGSISQIQTCCLLAAFFGQEIMYDRHTWPVNAPAHLDDAAADRLEMPDFRSHPAYENLFRQMDEIARDWGFVEGELNFQGVLNTAFRLRGEQIFLDMLEAPERARRVFAAVTDTMLAFSADVRARQRRPGCDHDWFVTANCVVNMISAELYREFIQPCDRRLAAGRRLFGIHNCAWTVDAYASAYAETAPLAYLDFGMDSDFALLARLFPQTSLCAMYSPGELLHDSPAVKRRKLSRLHDQIGACRIILTDIDRDTPAAVVNEFYRIAGEIWRQEPAELVATPMPW